jgi:hypothetical protein
LSGTDLIGEEVAPPPMLAPLSLRIPVRRTPLTLLEATHKVRPHSSIGGRCRRIAIARRPPVWRGDSGEAFLYQPLTCLTGAGLIVRDTNGQALVYVYF